MNSIPFRAFSGVDKFRIISVSERTSVTVPLRYKVKVFLLSSSPGFQKGIIEGVVQVLVFLAIISPRHRDNLDLRRNKAFRLFHKPVLPFLRVDDEQLCVPWRSLEN